MGAFIVNFHIKTRSPTNVAAVVQRLINTRAYVSSSRTGWVSVYEERTSQQETEEIDRLARELSSHVDAPVIAFQVHDSDVLRYWLYEHGDLRDQYNSNPDYFQTAPPGQGQQLRGNAHTLLKHCERGATLEQVGDVLSQDRSEFELADHRLDVLAQLLGIDSLRAGVDFRDFERGDVTPEEVDVQFIEPSGAAEYTGGAETREEVLARERFVREYTRQMHKLRDSNPQGALCCAVAANLIEEVPALLAAGADINGEDPETKATPLCVAIQYDYKEMLTRLIELGADFNRSAAGAAPLYHAVFGDRIECVKLLLEAGGDVNGRGPFGSTPLMVAASQTIVPSMVGLLLQAGADVNARNQLGETALSSAQRVAEAARYGIPMSAVVVRRGPRSDEERYTTALHIVDMLQQADTGSADAGT
jgi:Ankyrin repeats (3 copies)